MSAAILPILFQCVWSVFRKVFLGQISNDLQMADAGASDCEGIDISGIDEYIPDHFDGETDGFRHRFRTAFPTEGPGLGKCLSVKFDERTKHDLKSLAPTAWVTDSAWYLMKMVHNCSSNRQIGMILVAKCSYCICLQLVCLMLPYIHTRNSHIGVLKFGYMLK